MSTEADQALSWLRKAVVAGYNDVTKLQRDKEWDVLREREEFRNLLVELQAGQEKAKK